MLATMTMRVRVLIPMAVLSVFAAVGCSYAVPADANARVVAANDGMDVHPQSSPNLGTPQANYGTIGNGIYHLTAIRVYNEILAADRAAQTSRITLSIYYQGYQGYVRTNTDPDQAIAGNMETTSPDNTQNGPLRFESMTVAHLLNDGPFTYLAYPTYFELYADDGPPVSEDAGPSGAFPVQGGISYVFTRDSDLQ